MDAMEVVTDRCIRRGLGFAGLAVGMVMLSLSFDLALALRSGADLAAVTAGAMVIAAWRAPRRDMRHSEAWAVLKEWRPEVIHRKSKQEVQHLLREVLRRRLLWHAERVGVLALVLWAATAVIWVARAE
ncbi:hypothetical protein [Falsiroseomonas oryziterrae]|uniref:hypothetical protein n=1 Tax=Falsiroseomonas oryziterrae TaxID=2911368 RepID=UPI001F3F2DAA|nr:hypothetical protein [Roseomonas sp. NPKOSM-4]